MVTARGHSRELPGFYDAAKLFGDSETVLRIGLRQEDGELFAAVAADDIDLAKLLVKKRRDLANTSSPSRWPNSSFRRLNWSISSMMTTC